MARVRLLTTPLTPDAQLVQAFAAIRAEQQLPEQFSNQVLEQAQQGIDDVNAQRAGNSLSGADTSVPRLDATDVPLVTLDPAGSRDLDQAVHIERADSDNNTGFRVRYAIADVPAFVPPGAALDADTRLRGVTIYCPDQRIGLHPPALSEDAASLLPGQVRPALLWDLHLDAEGALQRKQLDRAWVQSHEQLDYAAVQQRLDADDPALPETVRLLAQVGPLRQQQELDRGGVSLPVPDQVVVHEGGHYALDWRPSLAVEQWNAQTSLLTGMAAAQMMLDAGVGIVRTMPAPEDEAMLSLRRCAQALAVPWPEGLSYGQFLRGLDHANPDHLAVIYAAAKLFRGAGYTVVQPGACADDPAYRHAAVAAPYAHVTAPLRRLVDRFALVCCLAISAGQPVPDWVSQALPQLPELMASADRRAAAVDRACTDAVEAALLAGRVGELFDAVVVGGGQGDNDNKWTIQLADPPVLARCLGPGTLGDPIRARLSVAEIATHTVSFTTG